MEIMMIKLRKEHCNKQECKWHNNKHMHTTTCTRHRQSCSRVVKVHHTHMSKSLFYHLTADWLGYQRQSAAAPERPSQGRRSGQRQSTARCVWSNLAKALSSRHRRSTRLRAAAHKLCILSWGATSTKLHF